MTSPLSMQATGRFKVAAGLLVLAAAGHALAISHHADPGHGGLLLGTAFAVVAGAQLLGAATIAPGPPGKGRTLVLVGTAVLVGLWALSRTVGLPYGLLPGEAERVGTLDGLTVMAELGVIGLLARSGRWRRLPVAFASVAVIVVGVAAFSAGDAAEPAGPESHGHGPAHHDHPRR